MFYSLCPEFSIPFAVAVCGAGRRSTKGVARGWGKGVDFTFHVGNYFTQAEKSESQNPGTAVRYASLHSFDSFAPCYPRYVEAVGKEEDGAGVLKTLTKVGRWSWRSGQWRIKSGETDIKYLKCKSNIITFLRGSQPARAHTHRDPKFSFFYPSCSCVCPCVPVRIYTKGHHRGKRGKIRKTSDFADSGALAALPREANRKKRADVGRKAKKANN